MTSMEESSGTCDYESFPIAGLHGPYFWECRLFSGSGVAGSPSLRGKQGSR